MEINFKEGVVILAVLLVAVFYLSPQIAESTGGMLGGSQAVGLVLAALAVLVFLFGMGKIK